MLLIARLIAAVAAAVACVWAYRDTRFDSLVAALGAVGIFAGLFVVPKLRAARQKQSLSGGSVGIQAGGDVHAGSVSTGDKRDDRR